MNLIYQFWDNYQTKDKTTLLPGVAASVNNVKAYADRIGAKYIFEVDPPHLKKLPDNLGAYYGALNPVFREEFHEYDNVLFLDSDVYTIDGLEESIFDVFHGEIGMVEEKFQPRLTVVETNRQLTRNVFDNWGKLVENRYKINLPKRKDGLLKAINSGVVVFSNAGLKKAKENFIPIEDYVNTIVKEKSVKNFFAADQHYINTCILTAKMNLQLLDYSWNTQTIFFNKNPKEIIFDRNEKTKFVHMQLRGMRWSLDEKTIWKIVNLPVEQWGFGMINITERERKRLL